MVAGKTTNATACEKALPGMTQQGNFRKVNFNNKTTVMKIQLCRSQKKSYLLFVFFILALLPFNRVYSQVTNEWNRFIEYDDGVSYEDDFINWLPTQAVAIAKDGAGNVYIIGDVVKNDFNHIYIRKYSPGGAVLRTRYFFTQSNQVRLRAVGIAVSESGIVYMIGYRTTSATFYDFPEKDIIVRYDTNDEDDDGKIGTATPGFKPSDIALDADGNVYITGTANIESPGFHTEMYTKKFNAALDLQWGHGYPNFISSSGGNALAVTASSVYVTGYGGENSENGRYMLTVKYNAVSGMEEETIGYEGTANYRDEAFDIALDAASNVYITGQSFSGIPGSFPSYNQLYTTIKYNSNLQSQWERIYDGALGGNDDMGRSLVTDIDGNICVTGISGVHLQTNIVTIKYNSAGTEQWARVYDGPAGSNDIDTDAFGNIYVTGWGIDDGSDIITFKYNPSGVEQWRIVHASNPSGIDIGNAMVVDASGNIYVAGRSDHAAITIKYIQCNLGCPENISVNNTSGQCGAIVNYPAAEASSACGTPVYSIASGTFFAVGTTTVTVASSTGESNCSFSVTVVDNQNPVITSCPAGITVSCAGNVPVMNTSSVAATDNCSAIITHVGDVITNQTCVNRYTLTRTYKATDPSGNFTTCQQVITVFDNQNPVITSCPAGITVSCAADVPVVNLNSVTAVDNCSGVVVTHDGDIITNQTCANRFTLTRTYKATDACGNIATCQQVITVFDNTPPQITGLTVSQQTLWPPNHTMRDITVSYGVNDNCTTPNTTLTITSNEPVNGTGDGDTDPDWQILDNHHIRLRAERAANGNGRIYTITITTDDGCNAPVSQSIRVMVAHNITAPNTGNPFKIGSTVSFSGVFWDKPGMTHKAKWLVDESGVATGLVTEPAGNQNGKITGSYKFTAAGVYKLSMNITDQNGSTSYANTNGDLDAIVVIYDPNGGYAFGGGWYPSAPGALKSNLAASGKASYGFAVNYKNAAKPKGETQFEFKVGAFEFNALTFDYLVVQGAKAQFKGTGKIIGGQSGLGFIMTVIDGDWDGSGVDKIRMKIYNRNSGVVYYDNQTGDSDADDPVTPVGTNSTIFIQGTHSNPPVTKGVQNSQEEVKQDEVITAGSLEMVAYPNPTNSRFTLKVNSNNKGEKIIMQVVDQYGRLQERHNNVMAGTVLQFGEFYRPGIYYVRIMQGKEHRELKLIKLSE
jgi:hypothetical protein